MYYAANKNHSDHFFLGVMGSNLKSSGGEIKAGEQIWRGDGEIKVYWDWANLKGVKRRELLNPKTTTVDNGVVNYG